MAALAPHLRRISLTKWPPRARLLRLCPASGPGALRQTCPRKGSRRRGASYRLLRGRPRPRFLSRKALPWPRRRAHGRAGGRAHYRSALRSLPHRKEAAARSPAPACRHVKARPGCAAAVSDVVDLRLGFPLDRSRAATLVVDPRLPGTPANGRGRGPEACGDITLRREHPGRQPGRGPRPRVDVPGHPRRGPARTSHTARLPADNDVAVAALHALFEDAAAGAALPALHERASAVGALS